MSLADQFGNRLANHDQGCGLREGDAEGLGDERHGSGGTWVGLEHIQNITCQRELNIDETTNANALSNRKGCLSDSVDLTLAHGDRRQCAARVSRVDSGLLDVLHHATDIQLFAVIERVDVDFDGVV